jgi:hypothetical protein
MDAVSVQLFGLFRPLTLAKRDAWTASIFADEFDAGIL